MQSLKYICATTGDEIGMNGPRIWAETAEGIRGRKWAYTVGYRSLTGIGRVARETELDLSYVRCPEQLDRTRRLMDADVSARTPGTLDADGWQTRCYMVAAEPVSITPNIIRQKLTVILLDGIWRKAGEVQRFWSDSLQPGLDLDYPHDYEHDYKPTTRNATAHNPQPTAMPFQMTIFGPATAPAITIGGNRYKLTTDIPSGAFATIVSIAGRKSVTLTAENGDVTDIFAKAERGDGLDGGNYIFQPIPPGDSPVEWRGFGFDLTVFEEESEPPWT